MQNLRKDFLVPTEKPHLCVKPCHLYFPFADHNIFYLATDSSTSTSRLSGDTSSCNATHTKSSKIIVHLFPWVPVSSAAVFVMPHNTHPPSPPQKKKWAAEQTHLCPGLNATIVILDRIMYIVVNFYRWGHLVMLIIRTRVSLESLVLDIPASFYKRTFNVIKIVYPRPHSDKFENAAFFLRLRHENGGFRKRWVFLMILIGCIFKFLRRGVNGKHLMRFQSASGVLKFRCCNVGGAWEEQIMKHQSTCAEITTEVHTLAQAALLKTERTHSPLAKKHQFCVPYTNKHSVAKRPLFSGRSTQTTNKHSHSFTHSCTRFLFRQ